jgi:hypothetical protein
MQVAVMDAEGKILPAGQPGELCVRGTPPLLSTFRTLTMPLNVVFIFGMFLASKQTTHGPNIYKYTKPCTQLSPILILVRSHLCRHFSVFLGHVAEPYLNVIDLALGI